MPRRANASRDSVVAWMARSLLMASVVCTIWWFGGVEPAPKIAAGLLILAALGLAIIRCILSPSPDNKSPVLALSLVSGWIGWACIQTLTLNATFLSTVAPGVSQTTARFRDAASSLSSAASISLVPEMTTVTLSWQTMVGIAFLLSTVLFDSKRSRLYLLIVVAANSVLLASWGIIQRSTGTSDLLPGFANPYVGSNPFASFVYKNSGGAAMILGIAAIAGLMTLRIGLLLDRMQSRKSRSSRSRSSSGSRADSGSSKRSSRSSSSSSGSGSSKSSTDDHYDIEGGWLQGVLSRKKLDLALSVLTDPFVILIGFGLALGFTGIASALSRGAWIGLAAGGAIFVAGFLAKTRAVGSALALVAITLVSSMLLVVLFENNQKVMVRVEMLDGEVLRTDDRWNHWPAAVQSLATYFPTGAGLGTYGFASLPFQENTYEGWYKQAHNQYLETAVESGLPGILLAIAMLCLFATWIGRLLLSRDSPERFAWGALVCIAAVGTAVQAVGDFVITTPGNTLAFAVLMGAAAGLIYGPIASRKPTKQAPLAAVVATHNAWKNYAAQPLVWCLIAVPVGILSQRSLTLEQSVDNLLNQTELPAGVDAPTIESCRETLNKFERVSEAILRDSRVQRRMGGWNEMLYRAITLQAILAEIKKPPTLKLWNATQLQTIFATLLSIPVQQRDAVRQTYMGSDSARAALQLANEHYRRSISKNPLSTQTQLKLAEMAPLMGDDYLKNLASARKLSGVSSQLLFSVGLLANYAGEIAIMNEAWSRSLEIDPRRIPIITELALKRETESQVVYELYPERSSLLISASRRSDLPLSATARSAALDRAAVALDDEENKEQLLPAERLQLKATIAEIASNWSEASRIYAELIRLVPREASVRFRYANILLQIGDTKNAWTQTNTAATLSPSDPQAERLFQQIDRARKAQR